MAAITYPLLTVVDDSGTIVSGATVGFSLTDKTGTVISNATVNPTWVTVNQAGPNVSVDYDVDAHGEGWVTLAISKSGSTFSGLNMAPAFYLAQDSSWLRAIGTAAADSAIHVLVVRPAGATHYRVEYLSGTSRQWWNGSALVGTEPSATALPSDRADGLLAFDVTGLDAGEYAVAFFNGATGTVVGTPFGATVGGGAAAMTLDSTQLAAVASAVLAAACEGTLKVSDVLKLVAAAVAGNLTTSGTSRTFASPLNPSTIRINAAVDGSGNRTVSSYYVG